MKTAPQLEDALSGVTLLVQQQRYDEALAILGELLAENPADRETRMYRLLVVRILVLRENLNRSTTPSPEYLPAISKAMTWAASAVRAIEVDKIAKSFVRFGHLARLWLRDRHAQSQSAVAELKKEVNQLSIKNQELLEEIASLSNKLGASERTVTELQTIQNGAQSPNQQLHAANHQLQQEIVNQQLHAANHQLQQEIADTKRRLQTCAAQLAESGTRDQEAADRYARLQNEVADLSQQLEDGHAKARALEALQQELANVESREKISREQQHELEAQVANLRLELSHRQETIAELDATRQHLGQIARVCRELRGENRRLEDELSRWRDRHSVRGRLEDLQPGARPASADSAAATRVVDEKDIKPALWSSRKGRSHLGILPAAGVVAIAAAVAAGFLGVKSGRLAGLKQPGIAPQSVAIEESASESQRLQTPRVADLSPQPPTTDAVEPAKKSSSAPLTALEKTAVAKHRPGIPPPPRLLGTFKITRPTQLYSRPTEASRRIASIGPGMKINVVDSRDGWLEIRSRHGRPSGFVRQEAAVRVDQN